MSIGSKRVTIRMGDDLVDLIREAVKRRNDASNATQEWKLSDYVIEAVKDKLNHDRRSRNAGEKVQVVKIADNMPREVELLEHEPRARRRRSSPDAFLPSLHGPDLEIGGAGTDD